MIVVSLRGRTNLLPLYLAGLQTEEAKHLSFSTATFKHLAEKKISVTPPGMPSRAGDLLRKARLGAWNRGVARQNGGHVRPRQHRRERGQEKCAMPRQPHQPRLLESQRKSEAFGARA